MAAEGPPDHTDAWLDALAGRRAGGPDEADARALREALVPLPAQAPAPDWALLVAKADRVGPVVDTPPAPQAVPGSSRSEAANQPQWAPRFGWAAALVLGTALVVALWRPDGDATMRGGPANPASAQAAWVVADPTTSAQDLAAQLRQAGAEVRVLERPDGLHLVVSSAPAHRDAVNGRLQSLDTAVDAEGRLDLVVRKAP